MFCFFQDMQVSETKIAYNILGLAFFCLFKNSYKCEII